jgi:hypothetical protein
MYRVGSSEIVKISLIIGCLGLNDSAWQKGHESKGRVKELTHGVGNLLKQGIIRIKKGKEG